MKKIAVLLPVYKNDKEKFLLQSINSILKQNNVDVHLFIGIDGPVGNQLKIVLNQAAEDKKVELVWFEKNRGLACVLNDMIVELLRPQLEVTK